MLTSKFPRGNKIGPSASPLHISQLIYQLIKFTFASQPDTYPFKWNADINLTGIVFDTVFNKEAEVYGKKPIVVCSCGQMVSSPIMIGDKAEQSIPTGNSYKVTTVNSSTLVRIISRSHAETEILKDEIFKCLVALRTLLPTFTNIHIVTNILADETRKFELDENMYMGTVSLLYMIEYAWRHDIAQNILNHIDLIINDTFGIEI